MPEVVMPPLPSLELGMSHGDWDVFLGGWSRYRQYWESTMGSRPKWGPEADEELWKCLPMGLYGAANAAGVKYMDMESTIEEILSVFKNIVVVGQEEYAWEESAWKEPAREESARQESAQQESAREDCGVVRMLHP
jgi:hypothetical protein